jgi:hypothetical protein
MDTDEGRPLARSKDKYSRVCRKLIHHYAYRAKPHLTISDDISSNSLPTRLVSVAAPTPALCILASPSAQVAQSRSFSPFQ